MKELVRTDNGTVVHREDCPEIIGHSSPWFWAYGRSPNDIYLAMAMIGARACDTCTPTAEDR